MKKQSIFILFFGLLLTLIGVSCGDDNDDAQIPATPLVVDNTIVTILQGDVITIGITSGNGDYAVKSFDEDVATASVSGDKITITAKANTTPAETTILLTDGRKKSVTITVKVDELFDLTVDNEAPVMFIGESQIIKIKTGNGGYVLSLAQGSEDVIEVGTVSGQVFTVKALKEGSGTITITDKKGKTTDVSVEVKVVDLQLDNYSVSINGPGATADINILGGNGGYTFTYVPSGIATATEKQNVITISATAVGTTIVTVKDQKGETKDIQVKVLPKNIVTDLETLTIVGTKKTGTFSILDGNGDYTVVSNDDNLMTAKLSGTQVSVTAKNAGTGTVTIADAQGITKQIPITITPLAMTLNLDYCMIANYGALANNNDYKALSQVTYEVKFKLNNIRGLQGFMGLEGNLLLRGEHNEGSDQTIELVSKLGGTEQKLMTQNILKTNVWYHLALVFDGTQANPVDRHKLYINGELYTDFRVVKDSNGKYESTGEITLNRTTVDLTKTSDQPGLGIGRVGSGDHRGLNGILAEARVWKVARTAQQIKNNVCNLTETSPAGLISHWIFGYGVATDVITDLQGTCDAKVYDNKPASIAISDTKTFPADRWVASGCPQ